MAGRKEYEMLFQLNAQLGGSYSKTFKAAQQEIVSMQKEIQALSKTQADISAFQKQQAAVEATRKRLEMLRQQYDNIQREMEETGNESADMKNKLLAKQLGRTFVDLDDAIVKADGRSIPDIFAAEGEDGFRAKETEQTARFGKENRQLLSCGGGVVKRPENLRALHQNGVVLFIDRPVEALAVGGSRPLSSSMEALRTMEAQRRPLYRAAADAVVPNTGTLEDALRAAMEALDEIFDS